MGEAYSLTMNTRTDIHRPSSIIPEDYQYVGVWTMNIQGIGDAQFILREREIIRKHMEQTKGEYAHVETTGSCQVCGNVQAIYLSLHYHAKSNTYLRVGFDCEAKLGLSSEDHNLFRRNVANAREAQAGKRKAIAILSEAGLIAAWDIYTAKWESHLEGCAGGVLNSWGETAEMHGTPCTCDSNKRWSVFNAWEERTIRDIVGKLVKYGSISEKQAQFVASLLHKIDQRPIVEAQRQAEKDAAGPVPTGRVTVKGIVLSLKEVDRAPRYYGDPGVDTKVLIKLENGSKVYGNRFANVEKGQTVEFIATIQASKDDVKFGFFKRATLKSDADASKLASKERQELKKLLKTIAYA